MSKTPTEIQALISAELPHIHRNTDVESLAKYGKDWVDYFKPNASVILFPRSTAEVAAIIKFANQHLIAVVPSGGRTGLSGGATAINGEMIVSLEKLNQQILLNTTECTMTVDAGVITHTVQEKAEEHGLLFPIDFAATGSSQIGGNIATNAGGIHVIKYGMTRNWVSGLTVVTGTGEILELNHGLVKNATGYDFRNLFIGSEGTLGIITSATLSLAKQPMNRRLLLLSVTKLAYLTTILERFNKTVDLRAFEFFDSNGLKHSIEGDYVKFPIKNLGEAFAVIEYEETSDAIRDAVFDIISQLQDDGLILEELYAEDKLEIAKIWKYREDVPVKLTSHTPYKNDLSVRISDSPKFIQELNVILKSNYAEFEVVWFGHIGDGNLHINILKPASWAIADFKTKCEQVTDVIATMITKYNGSISAEHGIGLLKKKYLSSSRSQSEIEYMRQVKKVFDPNGIMNPGKIF